MRKVSFAAARLAHNNNNLNSAVAGKRNYTFAGQVEVVKVVMMMMKQSGGPLYIYIRIHTFCNVWKVSPTKRKRAAHKKVPAVYFIIRMRFFMAAIFYYNKRHHILLLARLGCYSSIEKQKEMLRLEIK
jgi:hypothetical protein